MAFPTENAIDLYPLFAKRGRGDGGETCLLCGRRMRPGTGRDIHCVDGGFYAIPVAQEYTNEAADMGWWRIGADCAARLPAGYTLKRGGR